MSNWPTQAAYFVQVDGSCPKNPGEMGIGYLIRRAGHDPLIKVGVMVGDGTNNIAEYHSLINAVRHAIRFGLWNLYIQSDSLLMVNQIDGRWKVRDTFLKRLHDEAKQLLALIEPVKLNHISRTENTEADFLSRTLTWVEPILPPKPIARNNVPLLLYPWQAAWIKHWWMRGFRNSYFLARIFGVSASLIEHIGTYNGYRDSDYSEMPAYTRVSPQNAPDVDDGESSGAD